MKLLRLLLIAVSLCMFNASAIARAVVPIVNHENQDIPHAEANVWPIEKVKEAILAAGRELEWQMNPVKDGHIVATRVIRGKHTMVVDINYSSERYSVLYSNSINLNYTPGSSGTSSAAQAQVVTMPAKIHPNYNVWVGDLNHAIARKLSQF